eukprot:gene26826-32974_t
MGNHEYNSPFDTWPKDTLGNAYVPDRYGGGDSGGECGVPAKTLLGEVELFSGVTIGMVTVVSMNTEIDFDTGSDQWEFIKNQLAAVDRQQTPWVVLTEASIMSPGQSRGSHTAGLFGKATSLACISEDEAHKEEDLFAGGSAAHVVFIFTVVILAVLAVVLVFYGVTFYFYDRPPKNHFMLRE